MWLGASVLSRWLAWGYLGMPGDAWGLVQNLARYFFWLGRDAQTLTQWMISKMDDMMTPGKLVQAELSTESTLRLTV